MAAFERQAQDELSAEINRERNGIPGMTRRAAWVFRKLGRPLGQQRRIETWIDGVEVPILGSADFVYTEFVLELKTTFSIPTKPRADHEVQIVTYSDALGLRPGLLYVSRRNPSPIWREALLRCQTNREEFLKHYHKRSNAETVVMMLKTNFGDNVRCRTETSMANEVYCKIICHNIWCLIQSMYAREIVADFFPKDEEAEAAE